MAQRARLSSPSSFDEQRSIPPALIGLQGSGSHMCCFGCNHHRSKRGKELMGKRPGRGTCCDPCAGVCPTLLRAGRGTSLPETKLYGQGRICGIGSKANTKKKKKHNKRKQITISLSTCTAQPETHSRMFENCIHTYTNYQEGTFCVRSF